MKGKGAHVYRRANAVVVSYLQWELIAPSVYPSKYRTRRDNDMQLN